VASPPDENLNENFTNTTPALDGPDAQIVVINNSSRTISIITGNQTDNESRFEITGIAPNSTSDSVPVTADTTSLAVVDDSTEAAKILVTFAEFLVEPSTLTTLLVRENESVVNAVALTTETKTSDPGLAKIRVVQSGTLGNTSMESRLRLQSAGDNPGGVDSNFDPLTYDLPESAYIEVFAGDYELTDTANAFTPFAISLSGNTVYTLLLTGNAVSDIDVQINIDSQ